MSERPKCAVCGEALSCVWTDTHGVGACIRCGLPYRLYHYEDDERVDRPPSLAIDELWLPLAREYWQETRGRVFPACYDIGVQRGGCTYSGASREDCQAFDEWMEARKSQWPVLPERLNMHTHTWTPKEGRALLRRLEAYLKKQREYKRRWRAKRRREGKPV